MSRHQSRSAINRSRSRRDALGQLLSGGAALGLAWSPLHARVFDRGEPSAVAPRVAGPLRLGSNENPNGLGPAATRAFLGAAAEANRYPGRSMQQLTQALAAHHGVAAQWIHLAPGSGELLRLATVAFTSPSRTLVTAAPTFEAPARAAALSGATVRAVPVTADGRLDLSAMAANAAGAGLFFVCNPNNPTGGSNPAAEVTAFLGRVRAAAPEAFVLVDEAYVEYAADPGYATALPAAVADRKVLVTRTFSKIHGMAGLRVGYAIAHPDTLAALRRQGSMGTLSGASAAAALASLQDAGALAAERVRNEAARRYTRDAFAAAGFRVLPSDANFVMIDIRRDAGAFQAQCRERQLLVARPFPPLTTHVRLSIGTQAEMREAVPLMLSLLQAAPASAAAAASERRALHASAGAWAWGGEC